MNILYITTDEQDYLSDSLLIGLKELNNYNIIEYPGNNYIYKFINNETVKSNLYGNGFTLYNLIDKIKQNKISKLPLNFNQYDLIIFSSIARQYNLFLNICKNIDNKKIILIDGEDTQEIVPFYGVFLKNPFYFLKIKNLTKFIYFKRELSETNIYNKIYNFLSISNRRIINKFKTISFSIPASKIIEILPVKLKMFPEHIVDDEIRENLYNNFASTYKFNTEKEYYNDLQISKYGITTKRSGWDCLRHYEIAANGTVICFRDLDKKPINCAPHGLIIGLNCISYSSFNDLMNQINKIDETMYLNLQIETLKWAKKFTTENIASKLISNILEFNKI